MSAARRVNKRNAARVLVLIVCFPLVALGAAVSYLMDGGSGL